MKCCFKPNLSIINKIGSLKIVLLAIYILGGTLVARAGNGDSIKDSVVNIWDKVSDAAVEGSKVVKEKSVEIGEDVSDKAVGAWEWATEDEATDPEMEDGAFGDDSMGGDSSQDEQEIDPEAEDSSVTGMVEKSAVELWGRIAQAFASDESFDGKGYPSKSVLWEEINVDLSAIADRIQKHNDLPKDSLFGEDKESNRKKIDKLLNQILEVLEVTDVSYRKLEYAELEGRIREKNTEIVSYREKMVIAPEKVEGVNKVWESSIADYKEKIASAEAEIVVLKANQKEILSLIQQELLERSGIKLSDDQVYSLVVMVTGDSFVTLNSVFYNVKQLVGILEKLSEQNKDYINSVKKYYGMYAVLIEALQLAHEIQIDKIKDNYIPKLDEFRAKAQLASKDTKKLIAKNANNEQNKAMLNNNLRAQAEVFTAAGAYKKYLVTYLENLESSKAVIDQQLQVVIDTWKTTQLASGLLSVMKSSSSGIKNLVSMELPSIKPLNIGKLKDQLSMISLEIRE